MFSLNTGMWLLALVVVLYVGLGGLRSVAYVDTAQCIMLGAGIFIIGLVALNAVGGWGSLTKGISDLTKNRFAHVVTSGGEKIKLFDSAGGEIRNPAYMESIKGFLDEKESRLIRLTDGNGNRVEFWNKKRIDDKTLDVDSTGMLQRPFVVSWQSKIKKTPDGYAHFISIPDVIQFVVPGSKAKGGVWTGAMILTYMFALMGIQASPAFSMWAFANKNPAPFAPQQVWASSFGIGFIILTATWIQGFAGHILINNDVISPIAAGQQAGLVPSLINLMSETAPYLVGILAVCALAAMQSTGAAYMSTASGMLTRDIYKHLFDKNLSHKSQKLVGRISIIGIVGFALVIATFATDSLVMLGGLAVSYGFQMWPALMGICFFPWLTRQGITAGLLAGLTAVTLTYIKSFGLQYAWTIHSAGWGIFFNLGFAIIISCFTQPAEAENECRMKYHAFLKKHAGLPKEKRGMIPIAWILTIGWFLLAIGPLTPIFANTIFGDPTDASTWIFGIPSTWAWALMMWVAGVFMMWFLAYYMEMSTNIREEFTGRDDYADAETEQEGAPVDMELDTT